MGFQTYKKARGTASFKERYKQKDRVETGNNEYKLKKKHCSLLRYNLHVVKCTNLRCRDQ